MDNQRMDKWWETLDLCPELADYIGSRDMDVSMLQVVALNDCMKRWREQILELFPGQQQREDAFSQLLDYAMCAESVPSDNEIEELLASIAMAM